MIWLSYLACAMLWYYNLITEFCLNIIWEWTLNNLSVASWPQYKRLHCMSKAHNMRYHSNTDDVNKLPNSLSMKKHGHDVIMTSWQDDDNITNFRSCLRRAGSYFTTFPIMAQHSFGTWTSVFVAFLPGEHCHFRDSCVEENVTDWLKTSGGQYVPYLKVAAHVS